MEPTDCEAILCEDGWLELRDAVGPHRWLATDRPAECRP
jgi:hypothetical protein